MAFSQSSSSLSASPNVTPLIDVLLVLLIIFMVIVPVAPRGLSAAVPQPASQPARDLAPMVIEVLPGQSGQVVFRVGGQMLDRAELLARLAEAGARLARPEVFIAGDERLDYRPIAQTVGLAHAAGFHVIGLMHPAVR